MPPLQCASVDSSDLPTSPPFTPSGETKLLSPRSPSPAPSSAVLPPLLPSSSSSPALIIFDWDDTLLSSSFLSSQNVRLDSDLSSLDCFAALHPQLAELDRSVASLLSTALHCSPHVHIITNAETGWVQLSAAKFLPLTFPLLSRVRVLSARSTYEAVFPDCPHKWKFCAFQREVSSSGARCAAGAVEGAGERSVISLGDSHVEREAVRAATRGVAGVRCKSVKFAERSTCEQLRRQVELVTQCFHYIHHHAGDLDLQLTVTVNQPSGGEKAAVPHPDHRAEAAAAKETREAKADGGSEYDACGDSEIGSERESEHGDAAYGQAALASAQMAA